MKITRENYEAFFIDYLEGNLDENLVNSFIEFLQQNPDLKQELELFSEVSAVPESVVFGKKENLYREKYDLEKEFNEAAVARLEGDLNPEEIAEFEKYLDAHPGKKEEAALFSKTKLRTDESIRFEHKKRLYKQSGRKVFLLWSGRVAAVLVLAVAIFALFDQQKSGTSLQQPIADVIKPPAQEITPKPAVPKTDDAEIPATDNSEKEVIIKETPTIKAKPAPVQKATPAIQEHLVAEATNTTESAGVRETREIPVSMHSLTASLEAPTPRTRLRRMQHFPAREPAEEEWLIADNIREKINLKSLGKAGLSLFSNLSKERFTYETNEDGKITELCYDSRLVGFSIPTSAAHPQ